MCKVVTFEIHSIIWNLLCAKCTHVFFGTKQKHCYCFGYGCGNFPHLYIPYIYISFYNNVVKYRIFCKKYFKHEIFHVWDIFRKRIFKSTPE